MGSQKKIMCFLMILVVCIWGLDYIVAKKTLELFEPLSLLFFKYLVGLLIVFAIKIKREGKSLIRKKDIPMLIGCSISGEILYFACEYSALDYLPVSLITIILAFVPAVSVVLEKIIYKKSPSKRMILGILLSILGVAMIIGVDFNQLLQGRILGYLLAIGAVFSWNAYNFITASLHEKYESATLTFLQISCTVLITFPYAITHLPNKELIDISIIGGIVYLGVFGAGLAFLIQVKSLHVLGPTANSLFSNFLPITATFFGWLFLKETISALQILGGAIVIIAGYIVIKEKGRVEELLDVRRDQ